MPGIGLITNPRSRANLRDPSKARKLGYLIGSHGTAEATRSLDDLYRVCEEFKKERIEVLGISGGDGTLHHTLTAMIKTYAEQPLPKVAILRGGTMNTIARSLGIHGASGKLLFELVDKHRRGAELLTFDKRLLQVGDKFGFIFGNGVIYNFLREYYASENPSPPDALRLVLGVAASAMVNGPLKNRIYRLVRARVTVDGDPWACQEFMAIGASVVKDIGLGFRPFYRAEEQPGRFALLGLHMSALAFVSELAHIIRARPMRRDRVIDTVAEEAVLEPLEEKLEYVVDGDTYVDQAPLRLRLGPRLTFVRLTGQAGGEAEVPEA